MSDTLTAYSFGGAHATGSVCRSSRSRRDDTSTKVTMAFVGVLFALPVAALLARRRKGSESGQLSDELLDPSVSTSPRSLSANYWRDRGHPPYMKPSDGDPDKHMFDPDRLS